MLAQRLQRLQQRRPCCRHGRRLLRLAPRAVTALTARPRRGWQKQQMLPPARPSPQQLLLCQPFLCRWLLLCLYLCQTPLRHPLQLQPSLCPLAWQLQLSCLCLERLSQRHAPSSSAARRSRHRPNHLRKRRHRRSPARLQAQLHGATVQSEAPRLGGEADLVERVCSVHEGGSGGLASIATPVPSAPCRIAGAG